MTLEKPITDYDSCPIKYLVYKKGYPIIKNSRFLMTFSWYFAPQKFALLRNKFAQFSQNEFCAQNRKSVLRLGGLDGIINVV